MTEQVEYNQMQVLIKPYDMLTLTFYDAHSHKNITQTICLFRSQDNLHDMLTRLLYFTSRKAHMTK